DLSGDFDAVTIAVPTATHAAVAAPLLERGIPVLVEKPLARSVREADALVALAARTGTILADGHTERFNPAVEAARAHLKAPGIAARPPCLVRRDAARWPWRSR